MALHLPIQCTGLFYPKAGFVHHSSLSQRPFAHQCMISSKIKCLETTHSIDDLKINRRSANYQRSIWDFDFVHSLKSDYKGETYNRKAKKLEEEVKHRFDHNGAMEQLGLLELIDDIQRLGLGYLFEEDIKKVLDTIVSMEVLKESLHATALRFRLLRQHGYEVNQDMFNHLKDETGDFKGCYLADAKGLLSMYEASHLAAEGESILEEAKQFTRTALKGMKGNIDSNLAKQVNHALELPLHWRITKLEARWYMDIYEKKENSIPALIQLAKLDFNIVQAIYQENAAYLSRWWKNLGLGDQFEFVRDSLIPCVLWTIGWNPEPQSSNFRKELVKVNMLITVVDDTYDVYGTLEELELFTDAVERWDVNAIKELPNYMKIIFLALFNTVNEMAYFHLKEHGIDSIPFLKKSWLDLCKSYLLEAKWYYNGHKTTLQEYINNGVISAGGNVILIHSFFALRQTIQKEALVSVSQNLNLSHWSSLIVRFADDLGTSTAELERGDALKSIQSYMYETGVSEDMAREHISHLIGETWKKMNTDTINNEFHLSQTYIKTALNLARMSQCIYQHGDGHGTFDDENKNRAESLLFKPIPLMMDG